MNNEFQPNELHLLVLRSIAAGHAPEGVNQFDAYVDLRDAGLCGYDDNTHTVRPTAEGAALLAAQDDAGRPDALA